MAPFFAAGTYSFLHFFDLRRLEIKSVVSILESYYPGREGIEQANTGNQFPSLNTVTPSQPVSKTMRGRFIVS